MVGPLFGIEDVCHWFEVLLDDCVFKRALGLGRLYEDIVDAAPEVLLLGAALTQPPLLLA